MQCAPGPYCAGGSGTATRTQSATVGRVGLEKRPNDLAQRASLGSRLVLNPATERGGDPDSDPQSVLAGQRDAGVRASHRPITSGVSDLSAALVTAEVSQGRRTIRMHR